MYISGKSLSILITAAFSLLLTGCFEKKSDSKDAEVYNTVEVAKPLVKKLELWDTYTARIEGQKSVEIRSRVSGYLEKIYFKDGDFVKEGDILFEIDPRPFQALVEASQAEVKEIETRIELAQSNLDRARNLYEVNAISKEILDTRKSELLAAQAVFSSAQAKLKEATLNLEFTKTYAPISGYISRRRVDEGVLLCKAQGGERAGLVATRVDNGLYALAGQRRKQRVAVRAEFLAVIVRVGVDKHVLTSKFHRIY